MKKIIFLIILFFYTGSCLAQVPFINKVRMMYDKAATQEKVCERLISLLAPYNENNNPLLLGYKASATMMTAKYVLNPFSKLSHFNKGKRLLDKAINADKDNLELRFLRLAAQTNTPSFLGYDDHIAADKNFLKKSLPQLTDMKLQKFIISRMRNLNLLNEYPLKTTKP
ncbi:MAG TPA: hypothetical protein VF181_07320 [Balneolaceae bacterium]